MRRAVLIALTFVMIGVIVVAWGYWYSINHAALSVLVDDYALKTERQAFGVPHGVALTFRDKSGAAIAVASSVEPQGFILAVHPNAAIGNCQPSLKPRTAGDSSQSNYSECYEDYSKWVSSWAPRVHDADVVVGICRLEHVSVGVRTTNSEWWQWWVPLPHIGGLPRKYFEFAISIDSRACVAVR